MRQYLTAFLLATMVAQGCQSGNTASEQDNIDSAKQVDKAKDKKSPAQNTTNEFATKAAIGGMMEVESSAQLIKSTENPDVQTLATIMVKEHGMANAELATIAKKNGILLPKTLPQEKLEILKRMEPMKEDQKNLFYADLMVKEHHEAIALFEKASTAETGDLKNFAAKHLPALKHHLSEALNVQKIMKSIQGDKGDLPLKTSKANSN